MQKNGDQNEDRRISTEEFMQQNEDQKKTEG